LTGAWSDIHDAALVSVLPTVLMLIDMVTNAVCRRTDQSYARKLRNIGLKAAELLLDVPSLSPAEAATLSARVRQFFTCAIPIAIPIPILILMPTPVPVPVPVPPCGYPSWFCRSGGARFIHAEHAT
jgi:hypothetical protein